MRSSILALAVALVLPSPAAQNRPKIPPPDFEREWELDDDGLRHWKPYEVVCPHCKGSKQQACEHCKLLKEAKVTTTILICRECADPDDELLKPTGRTTCRVCTGTGKLLDPLVELVCPYCWGSSWYLCGLCNSKGSFSVTGAGVPTKCGACKQKGMLECTACDQERRVAVIKVGRKGVGEASAKDLREELTKLQEVLEELETFEPEDNPSKASKALSKILAPVARNLKVSKDMQAMLEQVLKGIKSYGAGYTGYKEDLIYQYFIFKDRTVYLLQFQIRLLEQCLELAEFNESASAK